MVRQQIRGVKISQKVLGATFFDSHCRTSINRFDIDIYRFVSHRGLSAALTISIFSIYRYAKFLFLRVDFIGLFLDTNNENKEY